ncbi:unnamed protein product [Amoebophrya sp. A25]|nr:unnamed protein product [Amoebophrya sp. A25]|eukprot:GSA25T00000722001.1
MPPKRERSPGGPDAGDEQGSAPMDVDQGSAPEPGSMHDRGSREQGSLRGSMPSGGPSAQRRRLMEEHPSGSPDGSASRTPADGAGETPADGATPADYGFNDAPSRSPIGSGGTPAGSNSFDGTDQDWDLRYEKVEKGTDLGDRLKKKIQNNFKHFIRTFQTKKLVTGAGRQQRRFRKGAMDDEDSDEEEQDAEMEYRYIIRMREMCNDGKRTFVVNFQHLYAKPECANVAWWLSQFPSRILPEFDVAATEMCKDVYEAFARDKEEVVHVAIEGFPCSDSIRKLRNEHLNQFTTCEAVVTRRTQVFNQLKLIWLICDKCGERNGPYNFLGVDKNPFDGKVCANPGCQSRFGFAICPEQTTYQNYQRVTLQEPPGSVLAGRMPRSKEAILSGEMVDSVKPGDLVQVTGIYRAQYDVELNAQESFPVFNTEISVNYIVNTHAEKQTSLTQEEITQLKKLSEETDIRERIIQSLAPSIHGDTHIKTAMALAMFGGVPKTAPGGHRIRGDLNVLILGDPGMAKSQFLKYVEKTMPRAVYTTGKGASGVGLTAAVGRDPVSGEWVLEGGAMVLADQGICLIDEFDKMNDQDRTSIHEAMEQQTISIAKAGICASLQARCSVIAAANPKYGRYDPMISFQQNVDLTDPILSRFDVLCVLKDTPDSGRDTALADFVVCSHIRSHPGVDEQVKKNLKSRGSGFQATIEVLDQATLKNYIQYARHHIHPTVSDMDKDKLARFYQEIRREAQGSGGNVMTVRHVESMVRMAEASAKMELRTVVTRRDVDHAISVMLTSFCQTQKHVYAQELLKKFAHYIVSVQDHFSHLNGMLSRQLTRAELLEREDVSKAVRVTITDLQREAKQYMLQDSVSGYLQSDLFRDNFVLEENDTWIRRITEEEVANEFSLTLVTPRR